MKKLVLGVAALALAALGLAQPFQWPPEYAATLNQGGVISEDLFGDFTTLNPVLISSAQESAVIGMTAGPGLIYRDWLGNRSFKDEDGNYNMYWAKEIDEVRPDQEFVITVREGWKWSDGVEMTADDAIAARTIIGDPDVESNSFACSVVDDAPVVYEKLGTYQYRITLPKPQVNALANFDCGTVPAHIFMPVYESDGAEGIKALWGVDTPVDQLVSGGPYQITEFRQGERIVLDKNPMWGEYVQAADGSPVPGPDQWVVTFAQDANAILSRVVTGQSSFFYPTTLDQVRAIREAVDNGSIQGELYANIGPSGSVDFITYNFNKLDQCKREMFRNPTFRQAIAIMIDRDALVQGAVGGLGFPAKDWNTEAAAPFNAPNVAEFEFSPDQGVEMLGSIGFTDTDADGVLVNPETGCRVEFDLQFNSGNNRRAQEALIISQTLAPYGVKVNPREVSSEIWANSIVGTADNFDPEAGRTVDYDAQIWGLAGGDVDNPSFDNGLRLGTNLNAWNKSKTEVEPWEILMDRLTVQMNETLDLDARVELYNERAELMRQYLPMTPLISTAFHFYHNLGNVWPLEELDANSIESPYRPGNYRELLTAP